MLTQIGKKGLKKETASMCFLIFEKSVETGGAKEENLSTSSLFDLLDVLPDPVGIRIEPGFPLYGFTTDLIDEREIHSQSL